MSARRSDKQYVSTKELYGPARIREIFTKEFRKDIEKMNSSELTDADIHTARRNAVGVNADLFVPNAAFEVLNLLVHAALSSTSVCRIMLLVYACY
jgi:hypothetical protein